MCKLMEDFGYKCRMQGAAEAAAEKSREFAIELWKKGFRNLQEISEMTSLPLKEVEELFKDEIE